ncbi:hypothetical protein LG047_17060 [Methylocystis sp. WRRC1]|uniref:hypothetical protein n=1 Tax=Methylocystis sp. WRRC1 TaxID=1732014 RepID=UPI001D149012|nr:hypothetical protein [Methylocystis sp. WRRC1]MCC3247007.1 hypothetical protein [Methylocystis sp. WRRC1]
MVFLAKCLICIALVMAALQWRPLTAPAPTPAHSARPAGAPQPPRRPQLDEAAHSLVQAGVDALATTARDKCLANPRECAAALQRLQALRER